METLKFLMVSTHYPPYHLGGDAVMVEYLARELASRGHEAHILYSPSVYEVLRRSRPNRLDTSGNEAVHRHEFLNRHPKYRLYTTLVTGSCERAESTLKNLCRRIGPDVVHWHNTKGFIGIPHSVVGTVSLYTAHDYYTICPRSNLTRPNMAFCDNPKLCQLCLVRWRKPVQLWRLGGRRIIRPDADLKILCPSEYTARRLRDKGIAVHGILRNFVPDPGKRACKEPRKRGRIVYVGMLEPHKGPQTLLASFIDSANEHDFRLAIVGDGSLRESLAATARTSQVADRIDVPGFVSREALRSILCDAAALVIPSEWPENAPLVALEALALGVPIIGSDQGGIPEIISPESGSRIYPAGDRGALSGMLTSVWEDRAVLDSLGEKARRTYESRFSPDIHIREYLRIVKGFERDATEVSKP